MTRPHEPSLPDEWELVCGLEVHCELATETKLFCGCRNQFGSEPNTNVCPTCLGLPGSLPVVNEAAVADAMALGRALECDVNASVFARKNYFYPDMPKDYQVSQYDRPTNTDGRLALPDGAVIGVERAHIEEDTGKSSHVGGDGRITTAEYSLVDYNRAGVPLIEIVSRPDICTADQAKAYVAELQAIVVALGISDAKMEEGSMRVDANISVRPAGHDELRTRCEIKNINSLSSLGKAIAYEARRHIDLYETGESPRQETRHWDEAGGRTQPGRSKEDADDYRYFPEPDLVPLDPSPDEIVAIDAAQPLLPAARREALAIASGGDPDAVALVVARNDDQFALAAIEAGADGNRALIHLTNNVADGVGSLTPEAFAALVVMEVDGQLSSTQTKDVLAEMVAGGGDPATIAADRGFEALDTDELESTIDELIAASPDEWARFCGDDEKAAKKMAGFFTGQVMKATQGQADGKVVAQILDRRRNEG
ncbi:MAG: Asp-tRNA(Asn)/Glu-tRNA(Gln) amidotransferase subunit GatB [Acidimicrobiales bacterium]